VLGEARQIGGAAVAVDLQLGERREEALLAQSPQKPLHELARLLDELDAIDGGISEVQSEAPASDRCGTSAGDPTLGLYGKPVVLIFEKTSAMSRYATLHLGGPQELTYKHYFSGEDALVYLTSAEQLVGSCAAPIAFSRGLGARTPR
jgi:hypothetical protein